MNFLAKLFYKTLEPTELEQARESLLDARAELIEDLQWDCIAYRAALIDIREYTASQKSGTARKVHRMASEALK